MFCVIKACVTENKDNYCSLYSCLFLKGQRVSSSILRGITENGRGALMPIILPNLKYSFICPVLVPHSGFPVFHTPSQLGRCIRTNCWQCAFLTSSFGNRELTNRRLSHDGAVGSPYNPAPSFCRNLNLRFAVKTMTFMRDRQIFSPFLKFVFIFSQGELFKPKCLTPEKREHLSHTP